MARKRKANVARDTTGKSRGERPADIKATVWAQRARAGILPDQLDNTLAGFTLGILRLHGLRAEKTDTEDYRGISAAQYEAGEEWARLCRWHTTVVCSSPVPPRSSVVLMVGGRDCGPDPDEAEVLRRRGKWRDCYNALMAVCRDHGLRARDVAYGVCVENWPPQQLREDDYGLLRYGLNAIGKVLR